MEDEDGSITPGVDVSFLASESGSRILDVVFLTHISRRYQTLRRIWPEINLVVSTLYQSQDYPLRICWLEGQFFKGLFQLSYWLAKQFQNAVRELSEFTGADIVAEFLPEAT
jgi:hypothetical protein